MVAVPGKLFGDERHILAIRRKVTEKIETLVFVSIHSYYVFYTRKPDPGLYIDLIGKPLVRWERLMSLNQTSSIV